MGTKDRRNLEKENRREHILDVAIRLMEQHGVHHLNVDTVAREAQLAKGTIYLYFKSKEEIIGVLSVRSRQKVLRQFEAVAASGAPPDEQLVAIIQESHRFHTENPVEFDLVALFEGDNALTETPEMIAVSQQISNVVAGMVGKAKAAGMLPADFDDISFTLNLWAMTFGVLRFIRWRGALLQETMGRSGSDLMEGYQNMIRQVLKKT